MSIRKLLLGILLAQCGLLHAKEIPLDQVWAYNMPDTKDVCEVEDGAYRPLADSISKAISALRETHLPGFAVRGGIREALESAEKSLTEKKTRKLRFNSSDKISLFFFANSTSRYVQIKQIETSKGKVEIKYELIPHETKDLTNHFALIPLGELSKGTYRVELVHLPLSKKYLQAGFPPAHEGYAERVVCKPFEFVVD